MYPAPYLSVGCRLMECPCLPPPSALGHSVAQHCTAQELLGKPEFSPWKHCNGVVCGRGLHQSLDKGSPLGSEAGIVPVNTRVSSKSQGFR